MDLTGSRFPVGPWCESAKCAGARLVWATTGKDRMLIEADPAPKGNIQLRDTGLDAPLAVTLNAAAIATKLPGSLHLSHFATCPDAKRYRRRK
jgi:hypothetical protein